MRIRIFLIAAVIAFYPAADIPVNAEDAADAHGTADMLGDLSIVEGETICGWSDVPSAEYTVHSDNPEFTLPDTAGQKVVSSKKNNAGAEIRVICAARDTGERSGGEKYLMKNRYLNTDHIEVRLFASKIIGADSPVRAAEREVFAAITDKNQGIPFIPVDEILRIRRGDCTEHTILLCSILRAAKIPSRAVVGLIFVPEWNGKKNVFVFHMWAEAFVEGKWILSDASFPKEKRYARYIALSYHSLKSDMPLDYLGAVSRIKNLRITRIR